MSQPPKEEKTEEQGHSGLTTLFPGQKRRISHLSKQGKEVREGLLLGPGWRLAGGRWAALSLAHGCLWQPWIQHCLCPAEKCQGPTSSHQVALSAQSGAQSRDSEMRGSPPAGSHCPIPVPVQRYAV